MVGRYEFDITMFRGKKNNKNIIKNIKYLK